MRDGELCDPDHSCTCFLVIYRDAHLATIQEEPHSKGLACFKFNQEFYTGARETTISTLTFILDNLVVTL